MGIVSNKEKGTTNGKFSFNFKVLLGLSTIAEILKNGSDDAPNPNPLLQEIADNIEADTWDTTIGNSKVLTYYAGTEPGHPAVSINEVKTIDFNRGPTVIFTQTLTYDSNNNVLTIVTT